MGVSTRRAISVWLFCCAFIVLSMVVLGGYTRLSGSGLSIVEWQVVTGILPPLDAQEWAQAFRAYRATPEFREVNVGLSLSGFQRIYLVEYAHRLLGRVLGLVFAVPFAVFVVRRSLRANLMLRLLFLFALGAVQGLIGWLMVHSGLVDVPHVSPFRLAAHLGLALLLLGGLVWTGLEVIRPPHGSTPWNFGWPLAFPVACVFTTSLWGALVAGYRAGQGWNTFPLMEGQWVPDGLSALSPAWRNPLQNVLAVQFTHRWLAMLTLIALSTGCGWAWRTASASAARTLSAAALVLGLVQASVGVATLLCRVPWLLALAHQAAGAVLFALTVACVYLVRAGGSWNTGRITEGAGDATPVIGASSPRAPLRLP